MENNPFIFGECANEVRDKVQPEGANGAKYIGLEHIEQGTLHLNGFGSANDVSSTKSKFSKGDILFGKLRPYFRKVVRAPFDGVCSTDIWVVRSTNGIDQGFLYYWMASQEFVDFSMQGSEGTKMPRAKWNHVSRHKVPFFTDDEQKAIAHILGSLDDKIELNRRMNETLEAMAQALFKSWFVDFDPVIDNALAAGNEIPEELKGRADIREALGDARKPLPEEIQNLFPAEFEHTEEMGWIPKGWRVDSLGNIAEILNGFAFKSKDYASNGVFVLRTKNFSDAGYVEYLSDDVYLPHSFLDSHKNYQCEEFDFFLVMVGASVGKVSTLFSNCLPALRNQNMWCFRQKGKFKSRFYINHTVQRIIELNSQIASGSARDFFRKEDFKRFDVVKPGDDVLKAFENETLTKYQRLSLNHQMNTSLAKLRDTLLPQLLSGEMRIPEAEKLVEDLERNGGGNGKS